MEIWEKVYKKLRKLLNLPSEQQKKESKRIKKLRKRKVSDKARWAQDKSLQSSWNERTALLGDYIEDGAKVIEFGAANLFLKGYLNDRVSYTGSDIVARFPEIVVCDLNEKPLKIDLTKFDSVVMSGVLEYIYDPFYIFNYFYQEGIETILFSYSCADYCKQNRLHNGWLSDFKHFEILNLISNTRFKIIKRELWKDQHLFMITRQ